MSGSWVGGGVTYSFRVLLEFIGRLLGLLSEPLDLFQSGRVLELFRQVVQQRGHRVHSQNMHRVHNQVVSQPDEAVQGVEHKELIQRESIVTNFNRSISMISHLKRMSLKQLPRSIKLRIFKNNIQTTFEAVRVKT